MSKFKIPTRLRNLSWSFLDNFSQQIVNFLVGIILARILLPEDFGVVGIVTVVMLFCKTIIEGGFGMALINKQNCKSVDFDTVFFTAVICSFIIYLILISTSEYIALYYGEEDLEYLLDITGIGFLFTAFNLVYRTLLQKKMLYKKLTRISFISVLISGCFSIILAVNDYGVISLVYRIILGQIITLILFLKIQLWAPSLKFSFSSLKEILRYSLPILMSNIFNVIQKNVYSLVIGKFFSPQTLGYYTRANTFQSLASVNITNTIQRVSFADLSKIESTKSKQKEFGKYFDIAVFLIGLTMLLVYSNAEEIILLLLGEKWGESIPILKALSFVGFFVPLYNICLNYLAVLGKTKLYFYIDLIAKLLIIPVVVIGYFYGLSEMINAIVLHAVVSYIIILFAWKYQLQIDIYIFIKKTLLAGLLILFTYFVVDLIACFVLEFESFILQLLFRSLFIVLIYLLGLRLFNPIMFKRISNGF